MSDPLAVIALITAAVTPAILVIVTTRERRAETRETWARQDKVADRLAADNADNKGRLEQIHTLVNSELTEARRRERDALAAALVIMRANPATDPVAVTELATRIGELTASLAVMAVRTEDAQAARAAAETEPPAVSA